MPFRWNEWNAGHATRHGVSTHEAEKVIAGAKRPYPDDVGNGKLRVIGPGTGGRIVQVIYLADDDGTLYVIHARPVTNAKEKRRYRKRQP